MQPSSPQPRALDRAESPLVYTTTSVSAYYYVCVRILLYVSSYEQSWVPPGILYHICVRILLHVSAYYYMCVCILVCVVMLTEQSTPPGIHYHICVRIYYIHVSAYYYMCPPTNRAESPRCEGSNVCVRILLHVSAYYYVRVRMLVRYMCPHTNRAQSPPSVLTRRRRPI
jgi:hypothetical protein